MFATLKSEFRKLLTVRSTYITIGIVLALVAFYSFYIEGFKATHNATGVVVNPDKLASEVTGAMQAVGVLISLVGLLLMSHEYRYNTIMYTLTQSRSRTKALLAKILTVSAFAVAMSLLVAALAPLMTSLGLHAKGLTLAHQTFPIWSLAWRAVFYGWGLAMAGLLFAALLRNQIAAIVVLFFVPGTVEALLGLLLKKSAAYLPFTDLMGVLQHSAERTVMSYGRAALIYLAYIVGSWIVAWVLFVRRDAN
ncbi:MAG TPA: ABC transporter permease [Candidatus Saccharimonadales bacterium]|nr:ABC transporter permease [Candidatus Saccharimonadales bacterium]